MSARVNHPAKSLFLFLVVIALGWAAYEFVYVRKILESEPEQFVQSEVLDSVHEAILDKYETDLCLVEAQRPQYRPNEKNYRVRITIDDECRDRARRMCKDIAELVHEIVDADVAVFAYNPAGSPVAQYIQ